MTPHALRMLTLFPPGYASPQWPAGIWWRQVFPEGKRFDRQTAAIHSGTIVTPWRVERCEQDGDMDLPRGQ